MLSSNGFKSKSRFLAYYSLVNSCLTSHHRPRSEAILAGFLAMIPPHCHVLRDGKLSQIPAETLVKGDIVLIRMGDKTPADMIIFASTDLKVTVYLSSNVIQLHMTLMDGNNDLQVDNSSLTGESEPQERMPDLEGQGRSSAVEARNIVFNSTMVVSGEGWGGQSDLPHFHRTLAYS